MSRHNNRPNAPQALNTGTVNVKVPLADYIISQFNSEAQALVLARDAAVFDFDLYDAEVAAGTVTPPLQSAYDRLLPFINCDEEVKRLLLEHVKHQIYLANI